MTKIEVAVKFIETAKKVFNCKNIDEIKQIINDFKKQIKIDNIKD